MNGNYKDKTVVRPSFLYDGNLKISFYIEKVPWSRDTGRNHLAMSFRRGPPTVHDTPVDKTSPLSTAALKGWCGDVSEHAEALGVCDGLKQTFLQLLFARVIGQQQHVETRMGRRQSGKSFSWGHVTEQSQGKSVSNEIMSSFIGSWEIICHSCSKKYNFLTHYTK